MKKPWLQMYLRELSRTSVRLMAGELIDPILDWVRTKSDFGKGKSKGKGKYRVVLVVFKFMFYISVCLR